MAKFNVGDKVRFADDWDSQDIKWRYFPSEAVHTVGSINAHGNIALVGRGDRYFKPERLILIMAVKATHDPKITKMTYWHRKDTGERIYICGPHPTLYNFFYYQEEGKGRSRVESKLVSGDNLVKTKPEVPVKSFGGFKAGQKVALNYRVDRPEVILTKPYVFQGETRGWYWRYPHETREDIHWDHMHAFIVVETTGDFIVINKTESGGLLPAARPVVHGSREEAEKEALRLAGLASVSGDFVVFQAVASAAVPARPKAVIKAL